VWFKEKSHQLIYIYSGFNLHESTNKNNKAKVNLKCKLIKIVLKGELI
tara:strand:+ start:205 stop:348 length:144 start_codon:yes stop_codon:yes gene_type:complete